jgi:putative hemin transport protein
MSNCGILKELDHQWRQLLTENPQMRIRDAAAQLCVSEAELLASQMVVEEPRYLVTRLDGEYRNLMRDLKPLGKVMALTRNDAMVHEKIGVYGNVTVHGAMGLALGVIDLRIFFNHFVHAFAVTEESHVGVRYSLQFFDSTGTAVHKIYSTNNTDLLAFDRLVNRYRAEEQSPVLEISAPDVENLLTAPQQLNIDRLREDWSGLKDVHHFNAMLKQHQVARIPAYQVVGMQYARPLATEAFDQALTLASERKLSIMVFVGNRGMIQIHTGPINSIKRTGPWFNILDGGFNLHANTDRINQLWLVRKPTTDGIITSLEMYDQDGQQQALLFGERENGQPESQEWRALLDEVCRQHGINESSANEAPAVSGSTQSCNQPQPQPCNTSLSNTATEEAVQ